MIKTVTEPFDRSHLTAPRRASAYALAKVMIKLARIPS